MKLKPITQRHKQAQAQKSLEKLARHLGPGARLPRVREMATALGLTVATLDQALRQMETRGLIVRKPRSGVFVSENIQQRAIGLVFGRNVFLPGISPFYGQLVEHCRRRASSHDERFSFFLDIDGMSSGSEVVHHDLVSAIEEKRLDGIILACRGKAAQELWLREQKVPLVVLGESNLGGNVQLNHEEMVKGCVERLTKTGCKTIGILGAWHRDVDFFIKLQKGKTLRPEWLIRPFYPDDEGAEGHEQHGYESVRALLRKGPGKQGGLPDGLVITDDMVARGACIALSEAGVDFERGIRIATHANKDSSVLREWSQHLIQAEFDSSVMVDAIFRQLEAMMSSGTTIADTIPISPHFISPQP